MDEKILESAKELTLHILEKTNLNYSKESAEEFTVRVFKNVYQTIKDTVGNQE
ncbi:hypothetical protein PP175_21555 [Aneurinibacillus sp. Ricciae_BoGa-3]|uniref:hypothetical protein n=1 Tax=Aneurinibacillus sp. Ricciae_BoGa-3 TaxID=3022697 RepID=UPI0023415119|nr:hypothetical protein [Aneurinibacillus sp. Ricciae_BoGa-3]WCK53878.1 hypothetical protein PP175_21555 [Aneurinibacillus sp. Ricciae_BoGa-3]